MKTFGQLIDEIVFESGSSGTTGFGNWVELTIKEVLDRYTAYVSYPELKAVVNENLSTNENQFDLPPDFQRLDSDSFYFTSLSEAGAEGGTYLTYDSSPVIFNGKNEGSLRFFRRSGNSIVLYPTALISTGDTLVYEYWRTGSSLLTSLNSSIVPDILVETVKLEVLAKASMTLGGKMGANYYTMAKDARVASFGATELPLQN